MESVRALRADEVECRVMTVTEKGFQMLLYKDARCDMNVLDETFGPLNWTRSHDLINGSLYCTISVWNDAIKQWVPKQDLGTESNTEKEKGEASDSFKRAGFNWNIGRELYTKIFIWVSGGTKQRTDKEGKPILVNGKSQYDLVDRFAKFHATTMIVDKPNNKILSLIIKDSKDVVVFSYGNSGAIDPARINGTAKYNEVPEIPEGIVEIVEGKLDKDHYDTIVALMDKTGVDEKTILAFINKDSLNPITTISEMSMFQFMKAQKKLNATLDKKKNEYAKLDDSEL